MCREMSLPLLSSRTSLQLESEVSQTLWLAGDLGQWLVGSPDTSCSGEEGSVEKGATQSLETSLPL